MRAASLLTVLSAMLMGQATPDLSFRALRRPLHAQVSAVPVDVSVRPGAKLTLAVDVTPNPKIHIYAPGAKDFTPIALAFDPQANLKIGKLTYPKSELLEDVPVFQKPFRLAQEVTLAGPLNPGRTVHVTATVHYQACDDKVCYAPESAPVEWALTVRSGQ